MNEQLMQSAEQPERLGDEAMSVGKADEALHHYSEARRFLCKALDVVLLDDADFESTHKVIDAIVRIGQKSRDAHQELQPPPKSLEDRAAELRAAVDQSTESGDIAYASKVCIDLGEILEELSDRDGAESAYRQAVTLARHVDAAIPELMLWAFRSLVDFLAPSSESITLAQEMAKNLIERDDMYHPMRAAEAAHCWAIAELRFAEVTPHRVDHAIDGIVRQAIEMLDDVCFHNEGQALQRRVAEALHRVGRDIEADQWQADADKYVDWQMFMDQEIPGHVHLWDTRVDLSDRVEQG